MAYATWVIAPCRACQRGDLLPTITSISSWPENLMKWHCPPPETTEVDAAVYSGACWLRLFIAGGGHW